MANVKVKALDMFTHGRLAARRGGAYTMPEDQAKELEAAGLVMLVGDAGDDDINDLVGSGEKMEPMTLNKMEKNSANKTAKK